MRFHLNNSFYDLFKRLTDLNLNFDTGIKSVTMGPTSNDNISVSNQNSPSSK